MDEALRARLQALHPTPPVSTQPAPPLPEERVAYQPDAEEVYEALRSFARSTDETWRHHEVVAAKGLLDEVSIKAVVTWGAPGVV